MSKKTPIGYLKCFCDFPDGEVKLDKNENPYFYCPDCSMQVLTHGGSRGKILKAKMRPVDLAVQKAINEDDKKQLEKEVEKVTKPKPKKEKKISDKKPESTQVPESDIAPPKKKAGFGMMGGQ